jgi:hypothetical protein
MAYLAVTIDTEEDNWGEYARESYSVDNIARIRALQDLFDERGIRPTYLVTYAVATDAAAVDLLARYREEGRCEIGTHPHPWNTPPVEEERTAFNSYISHLPDTLQFLKLKTLHDTIARNFGAAPTSYRSGRWGFSDGIARHLVKLQYKVDTSISPRSDWREYEGPDYSACTHEPFVYRLEPSRDDPGGTLLEVPATIGFVQASAMAARAHRAIARRAPYTRRVLRALDLMRVLNHAALSPETTDTARMIRLARALLARGTTVLNFFFHSPTLLPKCSPFVRTEGDATRFVERIDRFLQFANDTGLQPVTMSELTAENIGATRVQSIPARTPANSSAQQRAAS